MGEGFPVFGLCYHLVAFLQVIVAVAIIVLVSKTQTDMEYQDLKEMSGHMNDTGGNYTDYCRGMIHEHQTHCTHLIQAHGEPKAFKFACTMCGDLDSNGDITDTKPCKMTLWWAIISLVSSFALSAIQCVTCDCCGMGICFDAPFSTGLFIFWLVGDIFITKFIQAADYVGMPESAGRYAIFILIWCEMALFLVSALMGWYKVYDKFCEMCPCCEKDLEKETNLLEEEEEEE